MSISKHHNRIIYINIYIGIVTMYTKNGCPFCKLATELLTDKYGVKITFVDIENPEQRDEILQQMRTFSGGRNSVPQIFFNSDHIGIYIYIHIYDMRIYNLCMCGFFY
jgi:glutaredoxin